MAIRATLAAGLLLAGLGAADPASAQKPGGTLKIYHRDSPASMSILEEATLSTTMPMMGVFNNLLLYDQHVAQNSLQAIVPELATGWSWSEDGKELSFTLRQGVKWHDGRPFTANDVKCTWDLLTGKSSEKLRINPRKAWYQNLEAVTTAGDFEVTFRAEAAAAGVARPARLRAGAGLSLPRFAARHARPSDRHRPVQIRRVQAERNASGSSATLITGRTTGLISTASNGRLSRTVRRRSSVSPPASST